MIDFIFLVLFLIFAVWLFKKYLIPQINDERKYIQDKIFLQGLLIEKLEKDLDRERMNK